MRTFEQLTPGEQARAVDHCVVELLTAIVEGTIKFNDKLNHDDFQSRIDRACAKAERMRTPWFAHEYVMDACRDEIESMARCDAEDALYPDPDERIVRL